MLIYCIQNAVNCGEVLKEIHGMDRIMEIDEDSWSGGISYSEFGPIMKQTSAG
jgi:hypothetical protein